MLDVILWGRAGRVVFLFLSPNVCFSFYQITLPMTAVLVLNWVSCVSVSCLVFFFSSKSRVWLVFPRSERWRLLPCRISVTEQLYPLTIDPQRFRKRDICIFIVQELVWRQCNSHFVCHIEQREARFLYWSESIKEKSLFINFWLKSLIV